MSTFREHTITMRSRDSIRPDTHVLFEDVPCPRSYSAPMNYESLAEVRRKANSNNGFRNHFFMVLSTLAHRPYTENRPTCSQSIRKNGYIRNSSSATNEPFGFEHATIISQFHLVGSERTGDAIVPIHRCQHKEMVRHDHNGDGSFEQTAYVQV